MWKMSARQKGKAKTEGYYKCGCKRYQVTVCCHAEYYNCKELYGLYLYKVVTFVSKQFEVAGQLTKTLEANNSDIGFICDAGAGVSVSTTRDMPGLQLRKSNCQLTSADGTDLNAAGVCDKCISTSLQQCYTNMLANNMLGNSELKQLTLSSDKVIMLQSLAFRVTRTSY